MKALGVGLGAFAGGTSRWSGPRGADRRSSCGARRPLSPAGTAWKAGRCRSPIPRAWPRPWSPPCPDARACPSVTSEQMKAVDAVRGRTGRGARSPGPGGPSPGPPSHCSAAPTAAGSSWSPARATTAPTGGPPASVLGRRGVRVEVIPAASRPGPAAPPPTWSSTRPTAPGSEATTRRPIPNGAPVLAVDIPSGFGGDTGVADDVATRVDAAATVTFAAYKPGLLLGDGPIAHRSGRGGRHRPRCRGRSAASPPGWSRTATSPRWLPGPAPPVPQVADGGGGRRPARRA